MSVRISMNPEANAHIAAAALRYLGEKLGPALASEVAAGAPVDTGHLRDSVFAQVQGTSLIVGAEADYAHDVELGTSKAPAQPFIRPAVLRKR